MKWCFVPQERAEADLPALQRRRIRAGHVQRPRDHREGPASAHRGDDHRRATPSARIRWRTSTSAASSITAPRCSMKALDEARAKGFLGKNILGSGFDFDITVAPRRRRLHLRRRDGTDRVGRRPPRPAAREAAVPRRRRRVRRTDGRQQRRDAGLRAAHRQQRRGLVQVIRHARRTPARSSTASPAT